MPFKSKAQETFLKINYPEIARKWVKESKRYNQTVMANSVPITKKEPKMARNKKDVYKAVLNRKTSKKYNQTVKVKKENGKTTTTTTSSGTVRGTGKSLTSPTTSKDGVYSTTKRMQVHTPEGKRWYEGTGKSRDYGFSQTKARFNAQTKPVTDPADSLVTGGVDPVFTSPTDTKKKKKKKDKKRFWQLKK